MADDPLLRTAQTNTSELPFVAQSNRLGSSIKTPGHIQEEASPQTTSVITPDTTEHARAPGLTTRPGLDEPADAQSAPLTIPRPRALGNIALSVDEIDELFAM